MAANDQAEGKEVSSLRPLLRRADQACAAVVLGLALLAIGAHFAYQGGHRGRLIDIERADPQSVEFQLNLNEADWPELSLLPGIGEVLARRIVESREHAGPFKDHDDLRRVRGIGPKTVERIRPYLLPISSSSPDAIAGQ